MSEQVEIEFKNLLSEAEYHLLLSKFAIASNQIKRQVNHYFDTAEFFLKEAHSALRLREKGENYELTLKQPAEIGLLETNQTVSKTMATKLLQGECIPDGPIKTKLVSLGVSLENLEYFGSLTTDRCEFSYKDGLLVLDRSAYLNTVDYELEYETNDYDYGKNIFLELLKEMNIPQRNTENKIQRFYRKKFLG